MTAAQVFDDLAASYDQRWTHSPSGRLQREAFWRYAHPYFENSARVLDIGCGTGEDALRLMSAGARVTAIDVSEKMAAIARSRGVDARVLAAEDLPHVEEKFDVVMSNFGALNCVQHLCAIRQPLAKIVKRGGYAILCFLSRFCLWETVWFLLKCSPSKAVRRWSGKTATAVGLRVRYPRVSEIRRDLSPGFTLIGQFGVGILVPPSYVRQFPALLLDFASRSDERIAGMRGFRALADHTLLIFRRNEP